MAASPPVVSRIRLQRISSHRYADSHKSGDNRVHCRLHRRLHPMKFLSVRDLRSKSAEVWKGLTAEREMVVTSNGRPIAILSAVTEETLEETMAAIRRSRAVAAVSELQRQSVQKGKSAITPAEINAEIASVRRARKKHGQPLA
jgi:antitoxin (DNA-binding transcriptional repressor) of toxin-antitoxin stability system